MTGQPPGEALSVIQAARQAHQASANADALQKMSENLTGWGTSPAGQAKSIAQQFYPNPKSDEYQTLQKIAQAAGGGGQTAYNLMHMIDPVLGFAGASAFGGPGEIGAEIAGHALKPTLGKTLGYLQKQATQKAINQAYPTLAGGFQTSYYPQDGSALLTLLQKGNLQR